MACSTCGSKAKKLRTLSKESTTTTQMRYVVTSSDGEVREFSSYSAAMTWRRKVNGKLSTAT